MTPHIVIDPQGVRHIINAPDDATQDQIMKMAPDIISKANPSTADDILPSIAGGVERGVAGTAMILPDMLNQAVAGPQMLYRGLTGREHDDSPMWQPFYSSEDALSKLPTELQPHNPQTTGGKVAGFIGGVAGGVGAMTGGRAIDTATAPFYQAGRDKILADLLKSKTENPQLAATNIQNAPQYVPGSIPVAGVASGDTGLMGLQRGVENLPSSEQVFKDRTIQQTAAQNNTLSNVAGNPADIPRLMQARSAATTPSYEAATNAPYDPAILRPVLDNIDTEITKVGTTTQAGKMLSDMKANIIAESSNPDKMGPLIQMYKENRDNFAKKMLQDGAVTPAVKGVVNPANKRLGEALTRNNQDVAYADATFKNMSQPINQLEAAQAIKEQIQANSPNAAGQLPISQQKLQQLMENGTTNVNGKEMPLTDLTPQQQSGLRALQSDLNRNVKSVGVRVKPTPSSELNNLAAQSKLNQLISHIPFAKGMVTSKNLQLQQQLAEVLLNNPKAAELLLSGQPRNGQALAAILANSGIHGSNALIPQRGYQ